MIERFSYLTEESYNELEIQEDYNTYIIEEANDVIKSQGVGTFMEMEDGDPRILLNLLERASLYKVNIEKITEDLNKWMIKEIKVYKNLLPFVIHQNIYEEIIDNVTDLVTNNLSKEEILALNIYTYKKEQDTMYKKIMELKEPKELVEHTIKKIREKNGGF